MGFTFMSQTLSIAFETSRFAEIFAFAFAGFALSMALTPIYTTLAYRHMWWKSDQSKFNKTKLKIIAKIQASKNNRKIPTMAGTIFLISVTLLTLTSNLSREQTWVPLAAFIAAGFVGLFDDYMSLKGKRSGSLTSSRKFKQVMLFFVAALCSWYLYVKLDIASIAMPFVGDIAIGWLLVPLFGLVIIATANAVNISDGLDGLAGGLTALAFGCYGVIAFINQQYGIAAFCMTLVGALLSYTWFNLYPARFFMGNVGSFALGTTLAVIAILTNALVVLPIIGIVFVAEAGSVISQIVSQKLRNGKKFFKHIPVHYHFLALGWEETKVTMRFLILGQIAGLVGLLVYLIGIYGS